MKRLIFLLVLGLVVLAYGGDYFHKDFTLNVTTDIGAGLSKRTDTFKVANLVHRYGNLYPEVIQVSVGSPLDTVTGGTVQDSASIVLLTEFAGVYHAVATLALADVPCTLYIPSVGAIADSLYKSGLYIAVYVQDSASGAASQRVRYPVNVWTLLGTK